MLTKKYDKQKRPPLGRAFLHRCARLEAERSLDISIANVSLPSLQNLATAADQLLGGEVLHTTRAREPGGVARYRTVESVGIGPSFEVHRGASAHDGDDDESVVLVLLVPLFQSGGASRTAASTKAGMLEQDDVVAEVMNLEILTILVHQRDVVDDLAFAP